MDLLMRGYSFLSLFETQPVLAWSITATLGLAIALHAIHAQRIRRNARLADAAKNFAIRQAGRDAWELVDQKAHEKWKRIPNYDRTPQEEAAECAHLIGIAFDVDGHGLEWTAHHQHRSVLDQQAEIIGFLGAEDLARIIRKGADYCDIFARPETPGDTDDPGYQILEAACREIEEEFRAAGGIERYRRIVDDYLEAHYPWARAA